MMVSLANLAEALLAEIDQLQTTSVFHSGGAVVLRVRLVAIATPAMSSEGDPVAVPLRIGSVERPAARSEVSRLLTRIERKVVVDPKRIGRVQPDRVGRLELTVAVPSVRRSF